MIRMRPFYNPELAEWYRNLTMGKKCTECVYLNMLRDVHVCKRYGYRFSTAKKHRKVYYANVCRAYRRM